LKLKEEKYFPLMKNFSQCGENNFLFIFPYFHPSRPEQPWTGAGRLPLSPLTAKKIFSNNGKNISILGKIFSFATCLLSFFTSNKRTFCL